MNMRKELIDMFLSFFMLAATITIMFPELSKWKVIVLVLGVNLFINYKIKYILKN